MAQVDFFLKLDGINGDVTARGHEKWIEIQSFSWGVTNAVSFTAGGGGSTGKAVPSDFSLSLPFSSASPSLFKKAVTGQAILEGTLSAVQVREAASDFLKWKLSDILITSYQVEGAQDGPFEQISLNFAKIEVTYAPGGSALPITEGFDFRFNKVA